jgi:hypothetical protein
MIALGYVNGNLHKEMISFFIRKSSNFAIVIFPFNPQVQTNGVENHTEGRNVKKANGNVP